MKDASGRKKLPRWALVLLIVLAAILLLLFAGVLAVNGILDRMRGGSPDPTIPPHLQGIETEPEETLGPGETTAPAVNREDVTWEDVEALASDDIINVMLIGQDARPGEERARSDSMILVSINKRRNTIHLTSFMRDLYVQIPGYLDNRINTAYRFGGTELLGQTLQQNFGITVDGYLTVNFDQFQTIVDILGGVDIEMDQEEADYMNDSMDLGPVEAGMNHLNGEQALGFARIRYISGSDFARTERQRRIITSVAESLKGASATQVLDLMNQVLPYVSTDMSKNQIITFLATATTVFLGDGQLISGRVPADDCYYPATIDGASVLVPYLDKCQEYLRDSIFSEDN